MEQGILRNTAAAFAALDFTAENARVAEIQAEIGELEAAIERAETRCTEIGRTLREGERPTGREVADALLADETTQAAATLGDTRDRLEEERTSLRAGIGDLRRRLEDVNAEMRRAKTEAMGQVARAASPAVEEIIRGAQVAASALAERYAALWALNLATGAGTRGLGWLDTAVQGVVGMDKLLPSPRSMPVPAEIGRMLDNLAGKGEAVLIRRTETVRMP